MTVIAYGTKPILFFPANARCLLSALYVTVGRTQNNPECGQWKHSVRKPPELPGSFRELSKIHWNSGDPNRSYGTSSNYFKKVKEKKVVDYHFSENSRAFFCKSLSPVFWCTVGKFCQFKELLTELYFYQRDSAANPCFPLTVNAWPLCCRYSQVTLSPHFLLPPLNRSQ